MADGSRMGGQATSGPRPPRLPFKESIGEVNNKLDRLLNKINNFSDLLFPPSSPSPTNGLTSSVEQSDFAEMLDRSHSLIDECEINLDRIRDRF